jgi:lactate permease
MGIGLLGHLVSDSELYRRAWPLALPPLIVGVAAIALLL